MRNRIASWWHRRRLRADYLRAVTRGGYVVLEGVNSDPSVRPPTASLQPPAEPPRAGVPTMDLLDGPVIPAVQHWACPCGSKWDVASRSGAITVAIRCAQCGQTADIIPGPEPATGG